MLEYIIKSFIGVFLVSLATTTSSADLVNTKLQIPYYLLLIKSIGYELLMYIVDDEYKINNKSLIGIICCIPAFILTEVEHSIVDMFYLCCSGTFNVKYLIFIGIVLIGNAIGALLHKMIKTRKILKPQISQKGYIRFVTTINIRKISFGLHKAVACTFIPNPENFLETNHINGEKLNNHFSNLEWDTNQENQVHAINHDLKQCFGENNQLQN